MSHAVPLSRSAETHPAAGGRLLEFPAQAPTVPGAPKSPFELKPQKLFTELRMDLDLPADRLFLDPNGAMTRRLVARPGEGHHEIGTETLVRSGFEPADAADVYR